MNSTRQYVYISFDHLPWEGADLNAHPRDSRSSGIVQELESSLKAMMDEKSEEIPPPWREQIQKGTGFSVIFDPIAPCM